MTSTSTSAPARPEAPARRASRSPNRLRRAGVLAAGVALAAAAVGVQSLGLTREERTAHLTWTGGVGEEISASRFSARVKAVHAAKAVETTDVTGQVKKATTSQIFLIAEVGATANRGPQKLGIPTLLTEDGKRYAATDKVEASLTITNPYIQVGWWTESVTVFEVPATALTGSRIVLAPQSGFIAESFLPEVEVDLGLDEAATQRLISNAKDVYQLASKK
ncbi:hypothetical protein [Streptosporangium sp. NPDC000396]|uniref:hypothetical protein n=1 Tax=Streptosporangium sp. NPDC000396 TaxID=3366185 RepID=UPI0036C6A29F